MRRLKKELWPSRVVINNIANIANIKIWLGQNLGAFKGKWNAVYYHNKTDFYFRNEKDSLMFLLRWSC